MAITKKQIVSKNEIATDPCLTLVKAFRIANKRAGEIKRAIIESADASTSSTDEDDEPEQTPEQVELQDQYRTMVGKMEALAKKAEEEYNFHIWVNLNGKTGHTYSKDYKATPLADNDFDTHMAAVERQRAAVSQLLDSINPLPPVSMN